MLRTVTKGIENKTEVSFIPLYVPMMCLHTECSMLFTHNTRNWVTDMGQFAFIKQVNGLGDFSLKKKKKMMIPYKTMSDTEEANME